jgi:hypothetical protein
VSRHKCSFSAESNGFLCDNFRAAKEQKKAKTAEKKAKVAPSKQKAKPAQKQQKAAPRVGGKR